MNRVRFVAAALAIAGVAGACTSRPTAPAPGGGPLPLKYSGPPTRTDITAGDLMTRLYVFADDSMLGRQTGHPGNFKGTTYIASELARLGLTPGGENGTFFQTVPLVRRTPSARLMIGGDSLVLGTDFGFVDPRARPRRFDGAQLIYGGTLDAPASAAQIAGKVVVVNGYDGRLRPELGNAAAVIYVHDNIFNSVRRSTGARNTSRSADTATVPSNFFISTAVAERILGGPLATIAAGKTGPTVRGALSFNEEPSPLTSPARNVIGIVQGSDPALRNEYVSLGAHNDHVGIRPTAVDHDSLRTFNIIAERTIFARTGTHPGSPTSGLTNEERASIIVNLDSLRALRPARLDSVYNGADDDGSGSVGLLEIAEYFARSGTKPRRSLLFIWHTGEEGGLYGSAYFVENPTVPRSSIVANINIDMIGRGPGTLEREQSYVQLLGSRRLSSDLGAIVDSVNARPEHQLDLDYAYDAEGHPERIYCRSDHWNFARFGIPIVFFSDGPHVDYHQVTDEPQYIDYQQLARVSRFTRDVALEIANRPSRLRIDGPLPDPRGRCSQ